MNTFFGSGPSCTSSICDVANTFLYLINGVAVPLLFAIAFIVFLWGIAKAYILSSGEPAEVSKGHKLILWGTIAFAVMISVWGLVNVVASTFGLQGYYAPPLPTSYSVQGQPTGNGQVYYPVYTPGSGGNTVPSTTGTASGDTTVTPAWCNTCIANGGTCNLAANQCNGACVPALNNCGPTTPVSSPCTFASECTAAPGGQCNGGSCSYEPLI